MKFVNTLHPPQEQVPLGSGQQEVQSDLRSHGRTVTHDWIGHSRNRFKTRTLSPETKLEAGKCRLCSQPDSQNHCMLEYTQ